MCNILLKLKMFSSFEQKIKVLILIFVASELERWSSVNFKGKLGVIPFQF